MVVRVVPLSQPLLSNVGDFEYGRPNISDRLHSQITSLDQVFGCIRWAARGPDPSMQVSVFLHTVPQDLHHRTAASLHCLARLLRPQLLAVRIQSVELYISPYGR
jgi:hypothetical protein